MGEGMLCTHYQVVWYIQQQRCDGGWIGKFFAWVRIRLAGDRGTPCTVLLLWQSRPGCRVSRSQPPGVGAMVWSTAHADINVGG